jgi:hypothetical protein
MYSLRAVARIRAPGYVLMCMGAIGTGLQGVSKFPGAARSQKG